MQFDLKWAYVRASGIVNMSRLLFSANIPLVGMKADSWSRCWIIDDGSANMIRPYAFVFSRESSFTNITAASLSLISGCIIKGSWSVLFCLKGAGLFCNYYQEVTLIGSSQSQFVNFNEISCNSWLFCLQILVQLLHCKQSFWQP